MTTSRTSSIPEARGRFVLALLLVAASCGDDGAPPGSDDAGATRIDAGDPDSGGECVDEDGDGHAAASCGGTDCDDTDRNVSPDAPEICDMGGRDEDCDPATLGRDQDVDGAYDTACCNGTTCGDDCDDIAPMVYPGATEVCDGRDNDCDGPIDEGAAPTNPEVCNGMDDDCDDVVDEGATTTWYADLDGDGYGTDAATMEACSRPAGYADNDTDCDDVSSGVHPGAPETCDGVDNDCDAAIDTGCTCSSGDSMPCALLGRCAAGTHLCAGGMWTACSIAPVPEICANGTDEDCDGATDEGC